MIQKNKKKTTLNDNHHHGRLSRLISVPSITCLDPQQFRQSLPWLEYVKLIPPRFWIYPWAVLRVPAPPFVSPHFPQCFSTLSSSHHTYSERNLNHLSQEGALEKCGEAKGRVEVLLQLTPLLRQALLNQGQLQHKHLE